MKTRSGSRPKLSFQPRLERSEPRLLLSAGAVAHAQVSKTGFPRMWVYPSRSRSLRIQPRPASGN
jgi:hypothetical protein